MDSVGSAGEVLRFGLWRRQTGTGLERFELLRGHDDWRMRGTILMLREASAAEARYEVVCDSGWRTRRADVFIRDEQGERRLELRADDARWHANGHEVEAIRGCIDVDLGWSPSTNTLPIRRLELPIGRSSGGLRMAWVRFPELTVERLDQEYERLSERVYRYASRDGSFTADLEVDDEGLVLDYQGQWRRVTGP